MIEAGTVETAPTFGGATETRTPVDTQGTESVASDVSQGTEDQAGDSKESPEVGSANGQEVRQRGPSKLDTIRELRSKLREQRTTFESEIGTLKSQMEEFRNSLRTGPQEQKQRKTFWEAPEEVLNEQFDSKLTAMERRLLERLESKESESQQTAAWKQETSEAEKFIRSQKGFTPEDAEDIADIVRSNPRLLSLRPMERAEYALYRWQKDRGIGDRSEAKARASGVTGSAQSTNGPKIWTESEMNAEASKFPPDPKNWSDDDKKKFDYLDTEFKRAVAENRVKK